MKVSKIFYTEFVQNRDRCKKVIFQLIHLNAAFNDLYLISSHFLFKESMVLHVNGTSH